MAPTKKSTSRFLHLAISVAFFALAALGFLMFAKTTLAQRSLLVPVSSAPTAPAPAAPASAPAPAQAAIVQLGADGQRLAQSGGTVNVSGTSASLEWYVEGLTDCELENTSSGTVIHAFAHSLAAATAGVSGSYAVTAPGGNSFVRSVDYQLTCASSTGLSRQVSDTVTVAFSIAQPTNPGVTLNTNPGTISNNPNVPPFTQASSVDLSVNGQLAGVQGGSTTTTSNSLTLSWDAFKVTSCSVRESNANTPLYMETYNSVQNQGAVTSSYQPVVSNTALLASITYEIRCKRNDGIIGSVTDTVRVTLQPALAPCAISINSFGVDQQNVYENSNDHDVQLSWSTVSSCAYTCELGIDGVFSTVPNQHTGYDILNVSQDLDFELVCTSSVNPAFVTNDFTSVDYHPSSSGGSGGGGGGGGGGRTIAPTLATLESPLVTATTAVMRGEYDDGTCRSLQTAFEFGTSQATLDLIGSWHPRNGSGFHQATLQNLRQGATYYYRLVGRGCGSSTIYGDVVAFTTLGSIILPPTPNPGPSVPYTGGGSGSTLPVAPTIDESPVSTAPAILLPAGAGYTPLQDGPRGSIGMWILIILVILIVFVAARFLTDAFAREHHRIGTRRQ